jgi:predicted RNase H-like HicB family nuclease
MKTYTYTIQLERAEEGGYVVSVPALPGCVTQGETFEEAVAMAQDAIQCYIEGLLKDGEPIPEEPQPAVGLTMGVKVELPTAV